MKSLIASVWGLVGVALTIAPAMSLAAETKPLRALFIAGGCCHDYARQQQALCQGLQSRANVQVDVYWTDNSTTAPILPLYAKLNWAENYDVIIHDECAADIKDEALVARILQVHQKIPAVHLHCAMHSFRTGTDAWFRHLGLQSSGHGPQEPIEIDFVEVEHPILSTLSDWTTISEELYNNVKLFGAQPLAIGRQQVGDRIDQAVVAWVNETQGARSFSTTIGHNTETVQDPRYLELVTRGLLWACGKLEPEYLQPYSGENRVTFIDKDDFLSGSLSTSSAMPADATLVKLSASSTQSGNELHHAIDGSTSSRWCADNGNYPQWLQVEFDKARQLAELQIVWESTDGVYRYRVEGSNDAENWSVLVDRSENTSNDQGKIQLPGSAKVKFIRITGLGSRNGWCSIREVKIQGDGIKSLWPADPKQTKDAFVPLQSDPYTKRGNTIPRIEPLTSAEEAAILSDVRVADGFDVTVFAAPPAVNYPVFVAAAADGTVYVSSDGNGSLGRSPQRGRVIRLRDIDGDGRADETKIFCEIDAPRGLVWDHDRLYLMHPPHLSEFIDHDGDGVADEQNILVKNLAFGYEKRPADHTTNGLSLGVDGWLYIAGGDFGFIDAEGTDGRKLTHRGGGVIRVRPDGSGLEIYSTGTRNILEVAISPRMDLFARDNTNDGGGWDVRMHHFTGNDDHGYPRLYKNFADECVQPLADYGGGSGCGAVYIDEPGFGRWNDAPFTADWGTGSLFRHTVKPKGATFEETSAPESFIKMTRPTDADVDASSRVYCASWRGATFDWQGPNVGYIVCVKPKDFTPEPLPNFAKLSEPELVKTMESSSYRRRVEAQRELVRRGNADAANRLLTHARLARTSERNLVEQLQQSPNHSELFAALASSDAIVVHTAIRTLADRNAVDECLAALDDESIPYSAVARSLAMMHSPKVVDGMIKRLAREADSERKRALLSSLCRLHFREGDWNGDSWGTRPDTRGPYYQPETWNETEKIAAVLRRSLDEASPDEAAWLLETMRLNRIESTEALNRLVTLAQQNDRLLDQAVKQLSGASDLPAGGLQLLINAAYDANASSETLSGCVIALAKRPEANATKAMLSAMARLDQHRGARSEKSKAQEAIINSPRLDAMVAILISEADSNDESIAQWASAGLLAIASRENASPESRESAKLAIASLWQQTPRRFQFVRAAMSTENQYLDQEILAACNSDNDQLSSLAKSAVEQLKITPSGSDDSPKVKSMEMEDVLAQVIAGHGDISLGQQVFTRATCVACHTVREDEVQKGPYLGTIAKTYKRPELTTAILAPAKTIAQGFVTNLILTTDGNVITGFVTAELSDRVTLRDQQGKEVTVLKDDIEERKTSTESVMPTGLMNEFTAYELASLVDYLESLVQPSP